MLSQRYENNGIPTLDLNSVQLDRKSEVEHKIASSRYKFEDVNCAICNSSDYQQLAEKDRYGLSCQNVVCRHCGLVMINPRMTEASYNEFYNQEYRALYSGIDSNAANFFKGQEARGKRLYDYLSARGSVPNNQSERPFMLEVGCGAGGILKFFQDKGFAVKGIDLGEEYLSYGKEEHGLDLGLGNLGDLEIATAPDIIVYSHVLEHVLDLNRELQLVKDLCSESTLLYIEVPGIKNIALGYRNDPLRYFQNAHPYSFSLTSLTNLLAKHGFQLLHGDEYVKALFRLAPSSQGKTQQNDYEQVLKHLRKSESRRKYYFISSARLRVVTNAIVNKLKK